MTPFQLEVLLHYYARVDDHEAFERNPPIWNATITWFLHAGLLQLPIRPLAGAVYEITERGRAFVNALQQVPLPEACWIVRWPKEEAR